jgi:hypothetical protein
MEETVKYEIIPSNSNTLAPANWQMIQQIAASVYAARVFGAFSADEAAVKMLVAHDLGLPLTAAIKSIFIINQKPAIDTLTGMALIFRSNLLTGLTETRLEEGGKFHGWKVWMKRSNGIECERTFTLDDAKTAGLLSKDNWKAYPEAMCNYRAKAFAARSLFPDVLFGLNFVEEFDKTIDGQWQDVPKPAQPPQPAVSLDTLLEQYGPEAIMAANDGKIPGTDGEVTTVAAKLAGGK